MYCFVSTNQNPVSHLSDDLNFSISLSRSSDRVRVRVQIILAHTVLHAGAGGVGREDDVLQHTGGGLLLHILLVHAHLQHHVLDTIEGVGEGESLLNPELAQCIENPGNALTW